MGGGVLELGEGITIAEVAEKLYPHLLRLDPATTTFDTALDWIQDSMTEVKWEESPRAGYLKGPIRTRWVYSDVNYNSLSEAGKTAIRHLGARFPGIYAPRSAAAAAAAPVAPASTPECLADGAAAAAPATVENTAF